MPAVWCCYPADADGAHCAAVQYQGTAISVPPHTCMAGSCAVRRVCACTCCSSGGGPADGAAFMQLCYCEPCTWAADSPTNVCSCSVFVVKLCFEPLESPGVPRPRATKPTRKELDPHVTKFYMHEAGHGCGYGSSSCVFTCGAAPCIAPKGATSLPPGRSSCTKFRGSSVREAPTWIASKQLVSCSSGGSAADDR